MILKYLSNKIKYIYYQIYNAVYNILQEYLLFVFF